MTRPLMTLCSLKGFSSSALEKKALNASGSI